MEMKNSLTQKDIEFLVRFLESDKTPAGCMNLYQLDGFLTCLLVGPETIPPSQWIPEIWGEAKDDDMMWDPMEEAERVLGLIMGYYNMIAKALQRNPKNVIPRMFEKTATENSGWHVEDWCNGFFSGIGLDYDSWQPLLESEDNKTIIAPLFMFTTEIGKTTLEEDEEFQTFTKDKWEDAFRYVIGNVHEFWLPYRKDLHAATTQAVSQQVGRNDPCPCGSGKKYKRCCLS